jgi:hypothetical protein
VRVEPGMPPQSLLDLGMVIGSGIVGESMNVEIGWALLIDQLEEDARRVISLLSR